MRSQDPRPSMLAQLKGHDGESMSLRDDICGWVSGRPEHPLTCHPGQRCAVDAARSLVGCCWRAAGDACRFSTRCVEDRRGLDVRDAGAGHGVSSLDLVCYPGAAPYCKTDVFGDDPTLGGFSLLICGTDRVAETILRYTAASTDEGLTKSPKTKGSPTLPAPTRESSASHTSTLPLSSSSSSASSSASAVSTLASTYPSSPPVSVPSSPWTIPGAVLGSIGGSVVIIASLWLAWKLASGCRAKMQKRAAKAPRDEPQPHASGRGTSGEAGTQTDT